MMLYLRSSLDYLLERNTINSQHHLILKSKRKELLDYQWPFFLNLCSLQIIIGTIQIILQLSLADEEHKCFKSIAIDMIIATINLAIDKILLRKASNNIKFWIIVLVNFFQSLYIMVLSEYINSSDFEKQVESLTRWIYMLLLDSLLLSIQPLMLLKILSFMIQYTVLAYFYEFNIQNFGYHIIIVGSAIVIIIEQESKFRRLLELSELPTLIINSISLPVFVMRCSDLGVLAYNNMFKLLLSFKSSLTDILKQKTINLRQIRDVLNQFETQFEEKTLTLIELIQYLKSKRSLLYSFKPQCQCYEFRFKGQSIMDIRIQFGIKYKNVESILITMSEITVNIQRAKEIERTQLKSQLIKSMSHELRTRKNIIQGLLKIFLEQNEKQIELISQAYNNSIIESSIISSIINYNLCLENQLTINFSIYNVKNMINSVLTRFSYDLEAKGIKIQLDIQDHISLYTDEDIFQQIITNIINNCIKYSKKKSNDSYISIDAHVVMSQKKQRISSENDLSLLNINVEIPIMENYLYIQIRDNGCGMKEDKLTLIREIFSNDNIIMNKGSQSDGYYLGLRSCNLLLCQLNDRTDYIEINSVFNSFTEVLLKFKQRNEQIGTSHEIYEETKIQQLKCLRQFQTPFKKCQCSQRVLIVDDEPFNLFVLKNLITQLGFKVEIANNGYEAFEMIKNSKCNDPCCSTFFAIFMDYQMPIMNGVAATKAILKYQSEKGLILTPIIGCTAFSAKADLELLQEAGMQKICIKPINLKQVNEVLQGLH